MHQAPVARLPWAVLPVEILSLFLDRLPFTDHPRFGAVCKTWLAAAANHPSKRFLGLPFFVSEQNPKTLTFPFYSLPEGRDNHLDLPLPSGTWWFGCSHGWLFVSHDVFGNYLLNPLTKKLIPLPPLSPIPPHQIPLRVDNPVESLDFLVKAVLSSAPAAAQGAGASSSSSSSDLVALAIRPYAGGRYHLLVYCRPGYKTWFLIPETWQYEYFCDIIPNGDKGGFACLTHGGEIVILDLARQPSVKNVYRPHPMDGSDLRRSKTKYLVMTCGTGRRFLMVVKNKKFQPEIDRPITYSFDVYKLDAGWNYWAPTDSLEGEMLFLGLGSSQSLKAANVPWFEPNFIYFTDDACTEHIAMKNDEYFLDVGKFCVKDMRLWLLEPHDMQTFPSALLWFSLSQNEPFHAHGT